MTGPALLPVLQCLLGCVKGIAGACPAGFGPTSGTGRAFVINRAKTRTTRPHRGPFWGGCESR